MLLSLRSSLVSRDLWHIRFRPFAPLIPGVRVGEYNDMSEEKMKALVDESVCGVIVEPIQGEGGVGTAKVEWLELLGKRCREVGAALIFDEIQVVSSSVSCLPFMDGGAASALS